MLLGLSVCLSVSYSCNSIWKRVWRSRLSKPYGMFMILLPTTYLIYPTAICREYMHSLFWKLGLSCPYWQAVSLAQQEMWDVQNVAGSRTVFHALVIKSDIQTFHSLHCNFLSVSRPKIVTRMALAKSELLHFAKKVWHSSIIHFLKEKTFYQLVDFSIKVRTLSEKSYFFRALQLVITYALSLNHEDFWKCDMHREVRLTYVDLWK